jgi:hypothetical protein
MLTSVEGLLLVEAAGIELESEEARTLCGAPPQLPLRKSALLLTVKR